MNYKLYFLFILLAFLPFLSEAGVLKGVVTDQKGITLPYATIFIEGTTYGVTSNGNGDYEITISPGLHKVTCQYMGFKPSSFNVDFKGTETIVHKFVLDEESLKINEVVVKAGAEDPAYGIIRNAIKKRQFHLDQVHSFQTEIYLKGVARSRKMPNKVMGQKVNGAEMGVDSNGKGVLYLTEEEATYYSDGKHHKTIIHSVHESGNNNGLGFSQMPEVITFYDNNVDILGPSSRGFISPISNNAMLYYKYKYLGQFMENGYTVNKIQVISRRSYEPCFEGEIYIVDDDWAIHSLQLNLTKQTGLDMFDTLKVNQLFLPQDKDQWVIKSQVSYFTINIFGFDITANFVTVYNGQKVNQPIPDTIFGSKISSIYDKKANKKDTSYFTAARPIPLEADEKKDFVVKDSLVRKYDNPQFKDSLRRKGNKFSPLSLLTGGWNYRSKEFKNTYSTNNLLLGIASDNVINYNLVEGFNVAPKLNWQHRIDTGKYLHGAVAARYGFANTHFNGIARLYYTVQDRSFLNRTWVFGGEGGKYVFQYNSQNPVLPWFNTYSALFFRQNDLKLYERWDAALFVRRNYGTGLNWFVKASYQQRLPMQNSTDYAVLNGDKAGFPSNNPLSLLSKTNVWGKNDAALVHASISYKPGYTYTQYPDYKVANNSDYPRFTLTYDKGIPDIANSVVDFDKWKFNIQDEVKLKLLGSLKYNFVAGGFLNSNKLSSPDLMHLYGNRGIGWYAPYLTSFQFAQYYDFSNKEPFYTEAHLEYHLKGLLTNKIPLLKQAQWYLLVGCNTFYASNSFYYTEAFVGIDNIGYKIVRGLRIDYVQSWDSNMGRNAGFRFGLAIPGVTVDKQNVSGSEW